MKIKKLLLCAVLILPIVGGGTVFAQQTAPDQPVSDRTPADRGNQKTQEQRIAERKTKNERKFTQFELNQARFRCKAANGLIKSAQSRIGSFEAKRTQVYSGLVTRLQELSPKLQAAGADTAAYDEQVATLKTKADAYDAEITALKLAVDDLAAMDCEADTEGFMATLLAARDLRTSVIEKGKDFRTYLKDTFKTTFADMRTQIQAKKTEGEEQ